MYDRDLLFPILSGFSRAILKPYDLDATLEELAEAANGLLRLVGSGVSLIRDDRLTYAFGPSSGAPTARWAPRSGSWRWLGSRWFWARRRSVP